MTIPFKQPAAKIDAVELFFFAGCCLVAFRSGEQRGWSELNIPVIENTEIFAGQFGTFRKLTLEQAWALLPARQGVFFNAVLECAEIALIDLAARLLARPATELLRLGTPSKVPVLARIAPVTPEQAAAMATRVRREKFKSGVVFNLPGSPELDIDIVRAVRREMGTKAWLIGDCHMKFGLTDKPLSGTVIRALRLLKVAGLNACSDPARLVGSNWEQLQRECRLSLISDEAMHPIWSEAARPEADSIICRFHSGGLGSITEAITWAQQTPSGRRRIAICDSSNTALGQRNWRQLAMGLGAAWYETIPAKTTVPDTAAWSEARADSLPVVGFGGEPDVNILRLLGEFLAL